MIWTEQAESLIRLYSNLSDREIVDILSQIDVDVSLDTLRKKRQRMGVLKDAETQKRLRDAKNAIRCGWCQRFLSEGVIHQPPTAAYALEPEDPYYVCKRCHIASQ
jgi:Pyruvate/2-oxoacid:ferredoxin oxidoreductase delta subunit